MIDSIFSVFGSSPAALPISLFGIAVLLYLSWRWALPKPIPGIPYNEKAVKSVFGDMPEMMKEMSKSKEIFKWIASNNIKLNSPMVQIFTRPFSKPWVVIADYRESQDILMRRTKEFDRSEFFGDVFLGVLPDHHISMKSDDPHFKRNRALLKDLMTPAFLHDVAAPQIYATVETLLDFWSTKMDMANGHPFRADDDIYNAALDAIFAAAFPLDSKDSTTNAQLEHLSSLKDFNTPKDLDEPVEFPTVAKPANFEGILAITETMETSIKSPLPKLAHWCLRQLPFYKKAYAEKERRIQDEIRKSIERFQGHEEDRTQICALDDILRREYSIAKKENRAPNYNTRVIQDELLGFLIGGHDTTSTTIAWAVKFLADHPAAQHKLRQYLRAAFAEAAKEDRNPTPMEIIKSNVPFLDATIEEIVRVGRTAGGVSRVATQDSVVLGTVIPKGTDVFLMSNGPGHFSPILPVKEELRSESSRSSKGRRVGEWNPKDMTQFIPERWIAKDEQGNEVYDSLAGPHLTFGLGPRGCFGKRLAYLEMRLVITMILWNFELLKCPETLSGYAAWDKLTHKPQQCYLRLKKVE